MHSPNADSIDLLRAAQSYLDWPEFSPMCSNQYLAKKPLKGLLAIALRTGYGACYWITGSDFL